MKVVHKAILFSIILFATSQTSYSQGLSFSYLIPKDGYLSAPVSPFSVRGLGLDFGLFEVETGFTLYSIGGLAMSELPFETDKPLTGPHFSVLVPLQLVIALSSKYVTFKLKGGGFSFYHINPRLNRGNMDRAIRDFEGWQVANADLDMENNLGFGWIVGTSLEFNVSSNFSITTGVSYLKGMSNAALEGTYTGGAQGNIIQTVDASFPDAQTSLEGLEISLGVILKKN